MSSEAAICRIPRTVNLFASRDGVIVLLSLGLLSNASLLFEKMAEKVFDSQVSFQLQ